MKLLVVAGIAELTLAAPSGWLMVLVIQAPSGLRRAGLRRPKRIRQAHLDMVMMGTIQAPSVRRSPACHSGSRP